MNGALVEVRVQQPIEPPTASVVVMPASEAPNEDIVLVVKAEPIIECHVGVVGQPLKALHQSSVAELDRVERAAPVSPRKSWGFRGLR